MYSLTNFKIFLLLVIFAISLFLSWKKILKDHISIRCEIPRIDIFIDVNS